MWAQLQSSQSRTQLVILMILPPEFKSVLELFCCAGYISRVALDIQVSQFCLQNMKHFLLNHMVTIYTYI